MNQTLRSDREFSLPRQITQLMRSLVADPARKLGATHGTLLLELEDLVVEPGKRRFACKRIACCTAPARKRRSRR